MDEPKVGSYVMVYWHDPANNGGDTGTARGLVKDASPEVILTGGFFLGTKELCGTTYWFLGQDAFVTPKEPEQEYRGRFKFPVDNVLFWVKVPKSVWKAKKKWLPKEIF